MKQEDRKISKEKIDISPKEFIDYMHENMTAEFLQELIDYREGHLEICEENKKRYLFFKHNLIAVLLLTLISLLSISPFNLVFFVIGAVITIGLYRKYKMAKSTYEAIHGLHNVSEDLIKFGKKTIYGIS